MPENAVSVTRPGRFGNPFKADYGTPMQCVLAFEAYVRENPKLLSLVKSHLRGKNLACFCPLTYLDGTHQPCHADVLLRIANE